MRRPAAKGFTFIEILMMMVMLTVLLAILIPRIGSGMNKARKASCANNMKNIARALKLYSEDWNVGNPENLVNNLRGWYGLLYYPKTFSDSSDPRKKGLTGGLTTMKVYTCPATEHKAPSPHATGGYMKFFEPVDATAGNQGCEDPSFEGITIDYWIIRGVPNASYFKDKGYPYFEFPSNKHKRIVWSENNAILWEASAPPNLVHHKEGRNIAFINGSVKFIASWNVADYPTNIQPWNGNPEATTVAEDPGIASNRRYLVPWNN